jgi:hypothetical protein
MIKAMIAGQRDPKVLAALARTGMTDAQRWLGPPVSRCLR